MMRFYLLLSVVVTQGVFGDQVPRLPLDAEYEGRVGESGGVVSVRPEIRAENGPICGFRIVNNDWGQIPFEIFMKSPENGTAELKARHPLNCESTEKYELSIAAVACNGLVSDSRPIHVIVDDLNEYIPLWSQEEYSAELEEGELSRFLVRLEATDKDCSPHFGDICDYSISGGDSSFSINNQGVISNTRQLWSRDSNSHVLSVVATDCGGKESSPVLVTINITPSCKTSWSDVSTSMTYIPGTGPQSLFPSVHLTLCPDLCPVSHVETRITLHDHETDTCDRDTYDIISQRKMCGASNNAIDLLSENISPEIVFNNSTDDDDAVGEAAIRFSGEEGVVVPAELVSHDFGPEFTIHTWMRHARKVGKQSKEQIVCLSDDHRKSRHHTALFIRNCKLVFLNRRHYQEEERNVFKPAEWRWSLPQLTVLHPSYDPNLSNKIVSHQQMSRLAADLPSAHFFSQSRSYGGNQAGFEQGNAVVVVVIVSMGLLITVLAVGVVKLKSVATRELSEDGEVELGWDDCSAGSAAVETNITINPLETSLSEAGQSCEQESEYEEDVDSDEELYEEESDDEGVMDQTKERLAWDKTV